MSAAAVEIDFDEDCQVYQPGDTLSGHYALGAIDPHDVRAAELSVMWYTEGKGEEDLAVHYFDRFELHNGHPVDPQQPRSFSTTLPNSPLSYLGVIVKIRWCVRVRLFLRRGKDIVVEKPFQLGAVPEAQWVTAG